jgi:hypothetical protein
VSQELKPGEVIDRMQARHHAEITGLQDIISTLQSQLAGRERELAEACGVIADMAEKAEHRFTHASIQRQGRAFLASKEQNGG